MLISDVRGWRETNSNLIVKIGLTTWGVSLSYNSGILSNYQHIPLSLAMKSNLNTSCFRSLLKAFCSAFFFLTVALQASEQVAEVGSLGILRKDHTATVLNDGRVLILGGQNVAGELSSAEIYDPATRTFLPAGSMSAARIGHAATLLPDGKVLVTGGRNESGPLATAEIFDSAAVVPFRVLTAVMGSARQRHTSTMLSTGKVLLAGGDLSGTAEIYDPANETFSSPLIAMIEPRVGQTATTLPENSVLLAGGGSRSVELFDVQTSEFLSWSAVLSEIRTGQSAITAPDASLYFIGGEPYGTVEKFDLMSTTAGVSLSLGAPVSSATLLANGKVLVTGPVLASLFNPTTSALSPVANAGLLQRSGQTVTELPAGKQILVVGGVDANTAYVASAATYNPAHIVTDKQDYYPDEPVIVYGSGWRPGEGVDLYVVDDLGWMYDSTVTADADGLFTADPYFVVLMQHLGVTFDLTAVGAESGLQATHTFTDSPFINTSVATSAQSTVVTYGIAGTTDVTVTATRLGSGSVTATYTVSGLPGGVTGSYSPASFTKNGNSAFPASTLTLTVPATLVPGSYPFAVKCAVNGAPSDNGTGTGTLVVSPKNLTISGAVANNKVYDGTTTATVDFTNAILVGVVGNDSVNLHTSGYSATFGDKNVGSAKSVTAIGVTLTGGKAGNYTLSQPTGLTANITALGITGAFTASSKIYDHNTTATVLTRTLAGVLAADAANVSLTGGTATFADANVGSGKTVTLTGATLAGTAAANYSLTSVATTTANITALGITGNFTASNKVYDGTTTATILTRTLNGVISPDVVTLTGGTATFATANAGTGKTVTGTGFTLSGANAGNYTLSSVGTTAADIQKADASLVITPYSVTYDGAAHTASGTAKGVLNESLSGLVLTATTHTNAGAYASDAWTFTDVTGNYNNASGTVSDSVAKANAVIAVTPYSVTYDGAAHTATGTAKGVLNESLGGLILTASTHTNAGTYSTDAWNFTDATGNYNPASGTVSDSIAKANAVVVVTPYSVTYDATAHTAPGTAKGVLNESLSGLDLSATTHTDAGSYTSDGWTFTDVTGNYNNAGGTVSDAIARADATVAVIGFTGVYDAAAHGATGTATGIGGVDLSSGLSLGVTFTNAPGGTANWSFAGGTNYNDKNGTASIVINKATATVSVNGYTGVYDAAAHGATGSATGVGGANLSAGLDLGVTFTNAPGGTAHWTFTGGTNYDDAAGDVAIVINKATALVTVNGYSGVYDGVAHGATGSASGVGGMDLSASLSLGSTFTNAPGGTANWTFTGGTNYNPDSGSVAIVINKADATIVVTPYNVTFDAVSHSATGTATGVAGVDLSSGLTLSGTTHTNAGTYNGDTWSFDGGTNYNNASGAVNDAIAKADASVTVTPYSVTYDGNPHTAAGTAFGVGGADLSAGLSLNGTTHTNAGTYNGDAWTFADPAGNYNAQNGTVNNAIAKADAVISVAPYSVTYDGNAHTANATATGVKGESLGGFDLAGTTHTNAGSYNGDAWSFVGGTNYNDAGGSVNDAIAKADALIHVTPYSVTFDGNPHTAIGTATGVGGVDLSSNITLSGTTHTNAGTYNGDAWSFAGGTNYNNQGGSVNDAIAKADASIHVTSYSVTFDGNSHTATGTATGVGGADLSANLTLDGTTHTNAGTYNGDAWSFSGGANYNDQNGSVNDAIAKQTLTITAKDRTKAFGEVVTFAGTEFTASGLVGADSVASVTLNSTGSQASATTVGSPYPITASSAVFSVGLASNYTINYIDGKLTVSPLDFVGFLEPIGGSVESGNGGSFLLPIRSYKLGSTIPVKFQIFSKGALVTTGIHTLQAVKYSSSVTSEPAIDATPTDSATTGNQFRQTDGGWQFNLSTKGGFSAGTWLLSAKLADGTTHTVWIGIKK